MSTNQERRAEARQRLREQMEAQARREKQLKIAGGAVVVVLLLALVGVVAWKKYEKHQDEVHAANWTECTYPPEAEKPKKMTAEEAGVDPKDKDMLKQLDDYNKRIDEMATSKRDAPAPSSEQPKKGTEDITLTINGKAVPIHLDNAKAPCNVASFVSLVETKYFDASPCHRLTVSKDPEGLSVLQCGDPTGTGMSGPGYAVKDELPEGLAPAKDGQASIYPRGTVAMAKSQSPDSAGSQFFLVYKDSALPPQYSVMGTIGDDGLKVLDDIAQVGVKSDDAKSDDNQKPKKPVSIDTAVLDARHDIPEN